MGLLGALAQCALDFLVEERCHACGSALREAEPRTAPPVLALPVEVAAVFRFRLTSRILCTACAGLVRRWPGPVPVVPPGNVADAIPVHPAFVTDERLLTVIHLLKFGRRECLAPWLARAMMSAIPAIPATPDGEWQVVPVPMDRRARARRGFNQAESMARALAAGWQLPLRPHALAKVRRTPPQSALGRAERLANLEGAFQADPDAVRKAGVILVDDLVTTGATVRACAHALRHAGAREVRVVCAGYRDDAAPREPTFLQS